MTSKVFTKIKNITSLVFTSKTLERKKQTQYLIFLVATAFLLRLLVFFNTTIFAFSDFSIYYSDAFKIIEGGSIPVFSESGPLFISHLGAWFIGNFGSINYWFYTNILLSSLSLLFTWVIVKKITGHSGIANLTVLLTAFYPTFVVQPSVYYTQVIMIFLEAAILTLLILAYETPKYLLTAVYLLLSSALVVLTMFFKWELLYFYVFIGISAVYLFFLKYKKQALVSLLFCILTLIFLQGTIRLYEPIQTYLENSNNNLFFMGQTLYGGGEGIMLEKYRDKFEKGLKEFKALHKNEYDKEVKLKNAYQNMLIKDFVMNHPFQWAGLQVKKFFRTLGIKPEGVSFRLLVSGKLPLNKNLAGAILSFPFVILFLCCIFLFDIGKVKKLFKSARGLFIVTTFVYFIIATIFYPHFQIRYRMPLEFFFIIPAASAFIVFSLSNGNTLKAAIKKHFKWKIIVFLIFLCAWAYEAYDIFYLESGRYIKNAEKYEQGIIP